MRDEVEDVRLRNNPQARDILMNYQNYIADPRSFKGNWHAFFGNDRPIHLEIGSGKGQFIIALAERHPDINFIALERFPTVALKLAGRIPENGLTNLAVVSLYAEHMEEYIDECEISRLYLNFSDPWPKKRQGKRRLTAAPFLRMYQRILKDGSLIEFKTDNRNLFDYSLEELRASAFELIEITYDLYNSEMVDGNIPTEYEERFHGLGTPINKLIAALNKKNILEGEKNDIHA